MARENAFEEVIAAGFGSQVLPEIRSLDTDTEHITVDVGAGKAFREGLSQTAHLAHEVATRSSGDVDVSSLVTAVLTGKLQRGQIHCRVHDTLAVWGTGVIMPTDSRGKSVGRFVSSSVVVGLLQGVGYGDYFALTEDLRKRNEEFAPKLPATTVKTGALALLENATLYIPGVEKTETINLVYLPTEERQLHFGRVIE